MLCAEKIPTQAKRLIEDDLHRLVVFFRLVFILKPFGAVI